MVPPTCSSSTHGIRWSDSAPPESTSVAPTSPRSPPTRPASGLAWPPITRSSPTAAAGSLRGRRSGGTSIAAEVRSSSMLLIEHPAGYLPERAYILRVLLGEFLGIHYHATAAERHDIRITDSTGHPGELRIA